MLTFTKFNVPGAIATIPSSINNSGQIVGMCITLNGGAVGEYGFLNNDGSISTIGVPGAIATQALSINDSGEIAGIYSDNRNGHGFTETNGNIVTFDVPGGGGPSTAAVNASGQVTGSYSAGGSLHGYLYDGSSVITIDVLGATNTQAVAINDSGQIAGYYQVASGQEYGFVYNGGNITTIDVPGATFVQPIAINDSGEVTGSYSAGGTVHGFLDDHGDITTFVVPGATNAAPSDINDSGQITGYYVAEDGQTNGFLDSGGSFTTFRVPDAGNTSPLAINQSGEITGDWTDQSGDFQGFEAVVSGVICFTSGVGIATPGGEVPVDALAIGDLVLTYRGEPRRVVWIGNGKVTAERGRRTAATPVIIRKGALADNVPHRDLRITKAHALYVDDLLIPVEFLINHRSIVWDDHAQEVLLYHVELESHDVLIANGAPAESYRDDGNRWLFQNANTGWGLSPQGPCALVLTGGPIVDAVWRRLLDRAGSPTTLPLTDNPDLHLVIDGRRIDAIERSNDRYVFRLTARPRTLRMRSRAGVPQEFGIARDTRPLGVAVRRIVLAQPSRTLAIDAQDVSLVDGYHVFEPENDVRWTDGDASLPANFIAEMDGTCMLIVHLGGATQYLDQGEAAKAA